VAPETRVAHGVVVLAAGASTRLGRPKQLLNWRGETLVHRAARLGLATRPCDAVIVVGARADTVFAQVSDLAIRRIDCADWHKGMGASLHTGIAALSPSCVGALVLLCEQPALDESHLAALCAAWWRAPERGAASFYAGRRGVPALLPRAWFDALDATADRGMRDLLLRHVECIEVIANDALAIDIDLPDDLRHLS
jgi:CTP:molybdopterin cytidylyltransferase MocA